MRLLFFPLPFLSACNSATIFGQNDIRIESSFQPSSITLSNLSVYKIVIHIACERISGFDSKCERFEPFSNPQTFRSASFINGVPSVRLELSFQSKPDRQENFSIPSWNLTIGGKSYPVPPASLRVLAPNHESAETRRTKKTEADLRQAAFIEFVNPGNSFSGRLLPLKSDYSFGIACLSPGQRPPLKTETPSR